MTPIVAKKLLSLVNTKKHLDALDEYMHERTLAAHLIMEQATDPKDWYQDNTKQHFFTHDIFRRFVSKI